MTKKRNLGFTLAEVLIASTISLLVMTTLISVLIAANRIVRDTMERAEMTLKSRQLREKMLFRITKDGGLLTAKSLTVSTDGVGNSGNKLSFEITEEDDYKDTDDNAIAVKNGNFSVESPDDLFNDNESWLQNSIGNFLLGDGGSGTNVFNVVSKVDPATKNETTQLWVTFNMKTKTTGKEYSQTFRVTNLKKN